MAKLSPETVETMKQMAPGAIVRDGMLGKDRRPLPEIIEGDAATVAALGLTHKALGTRMEEMTETGRRGFGEAIGFEDAYTVQVHEVAGRMRCPFGDAGRFRKAVTTARRTDTGETFRWSDLGIHLVKEHGFFQGKKSNWRLDPVDLARFLGLTEH